MATIAQSITLTMSYGKNRMLVYFGDDFIVEILNGDIRCFVPFGNENTDNETTLLVRIGEKYEWYVLYLADKEKLKSICQMIKTAGFLPTGFALNPVRRGFWDFLNP